MALETVSRSSIKAALNGAGKAYGKAMAKSSGKDSGKGAGKPFDISEWITLEPTKHIRNKSQIQDDVIRVRLSDAKKARILSFAMTRTVLDLMSPEVHGGRIRLFHHREDGRRILLSASPSGYIPQKPGKNHYCRLAFKGPDGMYERFSDFAVDAPYIVHKRANGSLSSIEIDLRGIMEEK